MTITDALPNWPGLRTAYDGNTLELMTTSSRHEWWNAFLRQLFEMLTVRLGVSRRSGGHTTFRNQLAERGLEPDSCYWVQHAGDLRGMRDWEARRFPPPDLAIEIDVTSSSVDRQEVYARLGVPELWRWDGKHLTALRLESDGDYSPIEFSLALPFLRVADLEQFLQLTDDINEIELSHEFIRWVDAQGFPLPDASAPVPSSQVGFQHRYLKLADLRRLEQMLFAPRKIVAGRFSGHYQTRQRGQSIEFRDYREYLPGDEISAIDWRVYGRTDKLYIRLFEHQSELTLQLLVDASASMAYQGSQPSPRTRADSKYDYACRLAAAIGFLVMKQHDRFAFGFAQQGLQKYTPSDGTMRHLAGVLKSMESVKPRQPAGLDGRDRRTLARVGGGRSSCSAATCWTTLTAWRPPCPRIHSGGEAVLFHILHPDELRLPDVDHATFVDSESGSRVRLSIDDLRAEYTRRMQEFLDTWAARCRALGIDYVRAVTSQPYHQVLERYLIGRAGRHGLRG